MKSKTELDVWVSDLTFPGYMDWWAKQADAFERIHPEYRVNIKGLTFFTAAQEISDAVANGGGPAIAEYYFYLSQAARDVRTPDGSPRYTSIEKAIDGRTEILGEPVVIDDIVPALRDYYTYQGDLTSMPSIGTTSVLYANTDLLEAAGVGELPRTWAEVELACAAIAGLGNGPSHGITWANHGMFFQQALASQGGLLTDNRNGRDGRAGTIDLASPEMLAWARWWQRLHQDGHYLHTGKIPDWQGTFQAFAEQRVALRISSTNDVNYMVQAAKGAGFGIELGGYPYNGEVPFAGNAVAGSSFWLADRLDEVVRDGALAFLQYIHNPRNAAERHKVNSFMPLTRAAFDLLENEGWFDEHPYHRMADDQLGGYPDRQGTPVAPPSEGALFGDFARVQDIMTRAMGDVLARGADPAVRLKEATADAQRLLDAYNAGCFAAAPGGADSLRVEFFTDAEAYSGADLENVVRLKR
ncbi:extracellular solute-binding protein [Amycolatopsis nigrescens]|uniref:extracellular solute-binding protein n=1 Tax=Amycolatopsis nigrescens TaxID=381445 RepID=UPI000382C91A|nr:extracellular solute-binding protein [Amycolatopsis nigrescens]